MSEEDPYELVGKRLDARYEVERAVARGGFGVVYRGRHPMLDRAVAIKLLRTPAQFDTAAQKLFADAFVKEAQVIARLDHPAIVRVLDFGVGGVPDESRAPWMVLEWVDGKTLADDLKERRGAGGRTPAACLAVLRPVIEALGVAHAAGIAHRDIKPANLMLPARPPGATAPSVTTARVLDFGIAKLMEPDESAGSGQTGTRAEFSAFSLPYAAPEQVSAFRTGPWTDVHALGLILTEMLVDLAPYGGRDKVEVTSEVMAASRPTPRRFGVDVGAWEPVLARALAVRPAERFQSAAELLRALDEALPGASHTGRSARPEGDGVAAAQPHSTLRPQVATAPASTPRAARLKRAAVALGLVGLSLVAAIAVLQARRGHRAAPADAGLAPAPAASRYAMSDEVAPADAGPRASVDAGVATEAPADADARPREPRPGGRAPRPRPATFHGLHSNQI